MSKIMHMDTQYAGITPEKDFSELIDFFYPIGCYFETSDTSFNPNVSWSGSWTLETPGQVHVSAGTGYTVSGALSNISDGGEVTHILTPGETANKNHSHTIDHGHGFTQPKIPNHSHSSGSKSFATIASVSGRSGIYELPAGTGRYGFASTYGWADVALASSTGNPTSLGSCTGGSVTNHSGSSGGQTEANGSAHNNMQPYIVVNRWHRIA